MDSHELLIEKCREGYVDRFGNSLTDEQTFIYGQRINMELEVIHNLKFDDYFLFIEDICRFARTHDILMSPGRGSVAGCFVGYILRIHDVHSIDYGLYFERFLNKDRVSAPDIDLDFEKHKRQYVTEYVAKKWGVDRVANVVTYSVLQTKSLIKDLGKVMEIPDDVLEVMAKLVPFKAKSIHEALRTEPRFGYYVNIYRRFFEVAIGIEGCVHHTGKHAAGIIVGNESLENVMPLMTDGKVTITQWEKETLEGLNFLKADLLALKTLDIVHDTLRIVGRNVFDSMKFDDHLVIQEFTKGNSLGTFQFETRGMQETLKKVKPVSFDDLFAINALERPGASDSIDDYVKNRASGKFDCLGNEALRPIIGSTYGIILYQEQIMRICVDICGFSLSESDLVRRAISRKKGVDEFRSKFVEGAVNKGYDQGWAQSIFSIIEKSQEYSFNKSHAVAYTQLGFMTMFLKVYFPLEFLSVVLSYHPYSKDNVSKINSYLREASRLGIKVEKCDINASKYAYTFNKEKQTIRMGFCSLPHVGKSAFHISELQPFNSFSNFFKRVNKTMVRQNVMKVLIDNGCFDSIEKNRQEMSNWLGIKVKKPEISAQQNLL